MRELNAADITQAIASLVQTANTNLPQDMCAALARARAQEVSPVGKEVLKQLAANAHLAARESIPLCQDTGMAVVFADIGQDVHIVGGAFEEAVNKGVRKGYCEGYLRKSCVKDPLFARENTLDNTPAILHVRIVPGETCVFRIAPKGAGSENKSVLRMLVPADGIEGVRKTVLEAVEAAGANSCPPMVVGVGIGGNMEYACLLAKRAAARDLCSENADPRYRALEQELLMAINQTGIGPAGLGGVTTAFAVHIEWAPTHIAQLPVAVNINCHAARHAEIRL